MLFLQGVWTSQKWVLFLQGVWTSQKWVFFLQGVWTSQKWVFFLQGIHCRIFPCTSSVDVQKWTEVKLCFTQYIYFKIETKIHWRRRREICLFLATSSYISVDRVLAGTVLHCDKKHWIFTTVCRRQICLYNYEYFLASSPLKDMQDRG